MRKILELAENLSLIFTKLDTELGLAQSQLIDYHFSILSIMSWHSTGANFYHDLFKAYPMDSGEGMAPLPPIGYTHGWRI